MKLQEVESQYIEYLRYFKLAEILVHPVIITQKRQIA